MSYKIIFEGGEGEYEEKKSRFLAHIVPVSDETEALDFIAAKQKKYWDARHNCFAYVIGKNNELQRCSDDGEPSGTAGRPMLEILLKENLRNCIVVVTRYFGGTLLGTGGLVRSYTAATKDALANCQLVEMNPGIPLEIVTDYNSIGKLQYIVASDDIPVVDTIYTDTVTLKLMVPSEKFGSLNAKVAEITSGQAIMTKGEETEYGLLEGIVI